MIYVSRDLHSNQLDEFPERVVKFFKVLSLSENTHKVIKSFVVIAMISHS